MANEKIIIILGLKHGDSCNALKAFEDIINKSQTGKHVYSHEEKSANFKACVLTKVVSVINGRPGDLLILLSGKDLRNVIKKEDFANISYVISTSNLLAMKIPSVCFKEDILADALFKEGVLISTEHREQRHFSLN